MKKDFFIKYLELQHGKDYVKEENYYNMELENIIILEEEHYNDFLEELYTIIKDALKKDFKIEVV